MRQLGFLLAVCCFLAMACETDEVGDDVVSQTGEMETVTIDSNRIYEQQLNWLAEVNGSLDRLGLKSFAGEFVRVAMPELAKFGDDFIEMDISFSDGTSVFSGWRKSNSSTLTCRFFGKQGDHFKLGIYYEEDYVKLSFLGLDNLMRYETEYSFAGYSREEMAKMRMLAVVCLDQVTRYIKRHDAKGQESVLTKLNENF